MEKNDLLAYLSDKIIPRVEGDGGYMEVTGLDGQTLTVVFRGECAKCGRLDRLVEWIGNMIKTDLGVSVDIDYTRARPYFQEV